MSNKALVAASVNTKRERVVEDGGPTMESLEGRQMMSVTPTVEPLSYSFGVSQEATGASSGFVARYHIIDAWPK